MEEFDELDVIRASVLQDNEDQATRTFLRREYARLVETKEEQSEKIVSMTAMLRELQQTLSQLSNQLGIRQIAAESSQGRVDAKLRRMSRTAITPQESFSSPATIQDTIPVDKFSNQQVDDISGEKKDESHEATLVKVLDNLEEASVTQNQVPVSKLEPSLQISKDSPNVCENSQAVVGCEHQRSFQKNIRMHVVNGVVERSQRVMSITINVSAHQVFDKMCQLKRLKPKNKRKLHLSLKTWRFKFKNRNLQQNRSRIDHALDANIFHYISSSSRATFGFKWKEHNSRYWRRMRQTRLHMRHKWKSKHLRAVVGLQNNPSYALDVVTKPIIECKTTAAISQLVRERSVSHDCFLGSLWEKKSVCWLGVVCVFAECMKHKATVISAKLPTHGLLVFPWNLLLLEFVLFIHLEDKVCLSEASTSCYGWMVFDRGKNIKILGDVITLKRDDQTMLLVKAKAAHVESLMCGDVTFFVKHKWRFKYKGRLKKIKLTNTMFLWEKVHMVSCLSLDAQFHSLEFQLKHKWRSKHLYTMSALEFQVVESIGLVAYRLRFPTDSKIHDVFRVYPLNAVLGDHHRVQFSVPPELLEEEVLVHETVLVVRSDDVGRREFLIKWQDHDASESLWMFSKAFVHSYHSYKLEDKLGLQGVSIDTSHQSHSGRRRKS